MDFPLDICTHFPKYVTRDGKAGHRTGICLALVATTTEFSKRIVPIYTPLVIYEVPSHLSVFLIPLFFLFCISTVHHIVVVNCSAVPNSLQPHGLQHARLPCPSPNLCVETKFLM